MAMVEHFESYSETNERHADELLLRRHFANEDDVVGFLLVHLHLLMLQEL